MLRRCLVTVAFCVLLVGTVWLFRKRSTRFIPDTQSADGERRVADARRVREPVIREHFRAVGVIFPPREIFLRAFKREGALELWAREGGEPFRQVKTWPIVASSGRPGPKRREGDRQVPEGFYFIDRFNPESSYHLSLGLNYPNPSDRIRSDHARPGGDIFIHGKNQTIGCLPLGDEAIEELYLIALDTRGRGQHEIPVHIFPARMAGAGWETFAREHTLDDAALAAFWEELRRGYEAFEGSHRVPGIEVEANGGYSIVQPRE